MEKRENRSWNLVLIAVFITAISFPLINTIVGFTGKNENIENRVMARFPALTWENRKAIPHQFEAYFKDNFKPRALLFKQYSLFKTQILHVSPNANVVLGKNGWFFLGDGNGPFSYKAMKDYRRVNLFSSKKLNLLAERIRENKRFLDSLGIKYYVAVAPNSQSIYPEFLPSRILLAQPVARVDQVKKALNTILGTAFIDLKPTLNAAKAKSTENLYYQTNTHWNPWGAFIGYQTILSEVQKEIPNIPMVPIQSFRILRRGFVYGDLTTMIGLPQEYQEKDLVLEPRIPLEQYVDSLPYYPLPTHFYRNPKDYYIYHTAQNNNGHKALIFRDSFSSALEQFFPYSFSESIFIWQSGINKDIVLKEKPEAVFQIVVERSIDQLAK